MKNTVYDSSGTADNNVNGDVNNVEECIDSDNRQQQKSYDTTKTTFTKTTHKKKSDVQKKIENFQQITEDGEKCRIGSGMCAVHNTRVIRSVNMRRVSVVNKDGTVNWKMCEVTTLACPAVRPGRSAVSNDCLYNEMGGASKRARTVLQNENDQSDLSTILRKENEDLPLDENRPSLGTI